MKYLQWVVLLVSLAAVPSFAAVIHVPGEYPTIQAGIDTAVSGDTVLVSDGLYSGEGNTDVDLLGKSISLMSVNGPAYCRIDCQGSESADHRAFYLHNGESAETVISGFSIYHGYLRGPVMAGNGGAICVTNGAALNINNCRFFSNDAVSGGAVYAGAETTVRIETCVFAGNSAYNGGGIDCSELSYVWVRNSQFAFNSAMTMGGGLCSYPISSTLDVFNCKFTENDANSGGGIAMADVSPDDNLSKITSADSHGNFPGYHGIDQCTFTGNSAENGGGLFAYFGTPTIVNCVFTENNALNIGGALILHDSVSELSNCLIYQNVSQGRSGGGDLMGPHGYVWMGNCTVTSNQAQIGGALTVSFDPSTSLINNIFYGNSAQNGPEFALITAPLTSELNVDYSLVSGGEAQVYLDPGCQLIWGDHNLDADPLFVIGPLASYYLSHIDAGQGETSPCVNAGTSAADTVCYTVNEGTMCMNSRTVRTDAVSDSELVDLGYHYHLTDPNPCVHDGDVDQSGILTPHDALLAFMIYLQTYPYPLENERCPADCNHSGNISPADALCIFSHYLSGDCDCADAILD